MKKDKTPTNAPALDKARVLELLAEHPGATKRDLARMLGLKGSDRISQAHPERTGSRRRHRRHAEARLRQSAANCPKSRVLEITGTDDDGELLARPLNWDSNEEPPPIYRHRRPRKARRPGAGDRVLARLEKHGDSYEARIIRRLEREAGTGAASGVLREARRTAGGWCRSTSKARTEYALDKRDLGGAKHNELVPAEPKPGRIAGLSAREGGRAHRQHGFSPRPSA